MRSVGGGAAEAGAARHKLWLSPQQRCDTRGHAAPRPVGILRRAFGEPLQRLRHRLADPRRRKRLAGCGFGEKQTKKNFCASDVVSKSAKPSARASGRRRDT